MIGIFPVPTMQKRDLGRGGLLAQGAAGSDRGDIVQEILLIVRQVASALPPEQPNSLDDGLPGG